MSPVRGLSSSEDLSEDDTPAVQTKPRVNSTKVESKAPGDLSSLQDNSNDRLSNQKEVKEKSVSEVKR